MAEVGYIDHDYTRVEIDEQGNAWCIFNFEESSVIEDLQAAAEGFCIIEEGFLPYDEMDYL